jgi:hypothetical protein
MIFKLVLASMLAVKLLATALAQGRKVWFGRPHRSMIAEGRTAAMGRNQQPSLVAGSMRNWAAFRFPLATNVIEELG